MTRWFVSVFVLVVLGFAGLFAAREATAGSDVGTIFGVNEPHNVVVSPLNPHKVAVSAANAVWLSNDEGRTFFAFLTFPFPSGPAPLSYGTCGDSSLAFDLQGRLFWTILGCGTDSGNNNDVGIFVARINFDAGTFDAGFPVCAACGNRPGRDKQWIAVDANPGSPFKGNVYIAWSDIGAGANQIKFMRSTDGGATWSASANVSGVNAGECTTDPRFPDDATDAEGNLYIAWHSYCGAFNAGNTGVINLIRSVNGGADILGLAGTFPATSQVFTAGQAEVTWNLQDQACPVPGSKSLWAGALQPFVMGDPLQPGNVYVIANDDPNNDYCTDGGGDAADVVFARSTDYGVNWSRSTISHAPAGTFQVFPTGAIDQQGNMFATWYDNREGATNAGGDFLLDRYATVSRDGGLTWSNDFRINDAHFDPDLAAGCFGNPCATPNTLRIGEYNGAAAANGYGYVSFTGNNTCSGGVDCQAILFDVFSLLGQFPDAYEPNDSRDPGVATDLGDPQTMSLSGLTIHSALDEDFFRVAAHDTGKLKFTMTYDSRASDLDIQVQDKYGNAVQTSSAAIDSNDAEVITIPVVQGEVYFLRAFAQPSQPLPPENHYALSIVNTPAPVPFGIVLAPGSDSGRDPHDNVTNVNTPTVLLYVDAIALNGLVRSPENGTATIGDDNPGYKVAVYVNGGLSPVGYAAPTGGLNPDEFSFTFASAMPDGLNSVSARVLMIDPSDDPSIPGTLHVSGLGSPSATLQVTIDTAAPSTPDAPDLLASSDAAGVDDDNITTIQTPQFQGTGEGNALARLYAAGTEVGNSYVSPGSPGSYQVLSSLLDDGVYDMTVRLEDLAGNLSNASDVLKVTIAHDSLTLPGGTASPASGPVTVDLAAGTVAGFPGIAGASGDAGIVGIPTVYLAANGQALTILGTPGDDVLTYTPTDAGGGNVLVSATGQMFALSNVLTPLVINPLGGNDVVSTMGTANDDTLTVNVDVDSTVQVGAFLTLSMPTANVERMAISTLDGQDTVNVSVQDTVSANLTVAEGDPAPAPHKVGDLLAVNAASPKGHVQNSPGGPNKGSGVVLVTYPKTTGTTTRIDYDGVESVTK
jgi:hypothetical protein